MKMVKTLAIAALFAGSATLALAQNGPGINSAGTNLSSPPPGGAQQGMTGKGQSTSLKKHMSKKKTHRMPQ